MSSIEEKMKKIICEQLDVSEADVVPKAGFVDDLGADSLDQVELIVLSDKVIDTNPEWIKELRESMPNTKIVPGSGMCLSSGWLLLLLPCILLFRSFFRRKS